MPLPQRCSRGSERVTREMADRTMAVVRALLALGASACLSGCYTVALSDTTQIERRYELRGGLGARQGELVRIVRQEQTHYSGEQVSFGIMPGMSCMANDFGGLGGYVPASAMCVIVGPFVNAFSLATPTLCTLFVEPFTKTSERRGLKWDVIAMGFVGVYRWRVPSHDEVGGVQVEDVLTDGGYRPDLAGIEVATSRDGTKLWHGYPGYAALMRDVRNDGKVDVLHSSGTRVRRFRLSPDHADRLSFEDFAVDK